MKTKHFRIEEEDWERFKELSWKAGSNASVEIRKFIKKYNEKLSYVEIFEEILHDHKETLDALAED